MGTGGRRRLLKMLGDDAACRGTLISLCVRQASVATFDTYSARLSRSQHLFTHSNIARDSPLPFL